MMARCILITPVRDILFFTKVVVYLTTSFVYADCDFLNTVLLIGILCLTTVFVYIGRKCF